MAKSSRTKPQRQKLAGEYKHLHDKKKNNIDQLLFTDVSNLIEEARQYVAQTVNTTLSLLYWKIGKRIRSEVLKNKRAEYGKQIIGSLAGQLIEKYGKGWDEKTLRHCLRNAETIGVDAFKNNHVFKGWFAARVLYRNEYHGKVEHPKAAG